MQVKSDGWPFLLRFEVPDCPESLFPPMFAASLNPRVKKLSEADLSNFDPRHFEEEEDALEWDVFAFDDIEDNDDVEETEDSMMNDYENSESDEDEDDEDFEQEQDFVAGEDLAGHVRIFFLGSSATSTRRRDPSSPPLLHPLGLEDKWDFKPPRFSANQCGRKIQCEPGPYLATQKKWHCSCYPGLACLAHCLQTWETTPPALVGAC